MTLYDDGTPVQPGDYVRAEWHHAEPVAVEGTRDWIETVFARLDTAASVRRIDRPAKPRPPLPTQLGAVVWVAGDSVVFASTDPTLPWYSNGAESWVTVAWLAEQDWTTTPPEAS